ncbi:MAG: ROK family protein [Pseudomonadota bacterium]
MLPTAAPRAEATLKPGERLVAIDVGGTTTRIGLVTSSPNQSIASEPMTRMPSAALGADPVEGLARAIRAAVPAGERLGGAVIGLPVSFDAQGVTAMSSPNIEGFEGRAVARELANQLGVPVAVDRDTVLLATGEWVAGAAQGARTVLGVFIGTGIGGAMLIDGAPYRGASGGAGEVGHLPIRNEGRPCVCGNVDCLEAYASGHVLDALAARLGISVSDIFTAPAARKGVDDYREALAHGLAAAVNMLDPHVLLIGGGLFGRAHFPRKALARGIKEHLRAPVPRDHVKIVEAQLGSEAALYAAPYLYARHATFPHE